MTFLSLLQAVTILFAIVGPIAIVKWPRDVDGKLLSPEQVQAWLDGLSMREPPLYESVVIWAEIFIIIAALATAIGRA